MTTNLISNEAMAILYRQIRAATEDKNCEAKVRLLGAGGVQILVKWNVGGPLFYEGEITAERHLEAMRADTEDQLVDEWIDATIKIITDLTAAAKIVPPNVTDDLSKQIRDNADKAIAMAASLKPAANDPKP